MATAVKGTFARWLLLIICIGYRIYRSSLSLSSISFIFFSFSLPLSVHRRSFPSKWFRLFVILLSITYLFFQMA